MDNITKTGEFNMDRVKKEDVYSIKNPAYVVKQFEKEAEEGGCVVTWNQEFENLTNYTPLEIDKGSCHKLFQGFQWVNGTYVQVCRDVCRFRAPKIEVLLEGEKESTHEACVLRNIWVSSKYTKDSKKQDLKRCVDIYIFPFMDVIVKKEGKNKIKEKKWFALHILIDKGGKHALWYFNRMLKKEYGVSFETKTTTKQ